MCGIVAEPKEKGQLKCMPFCLSERRMDGVSKKREADTFAAHRFVIHGFMFMFMFEFVFMHSFVHLNRRSLMK